MKPEQHERVGALFLAALKLGPNERPALLDKTCGDDADLRSAVEALLAGDQRTLDLEAVPGLNVRDGLTQLDEQARTVNTLPQDAKLPTSIGDYRIIRVLGTGGMGTVYLAEQSHPRRQVALKVMRRGIASRSALRRFDYESQILARLRHPAIAQIFEAGKHTEGDADLPFFAMEYIPGARTITDYAMQQKLGTRERLALFATICDAINYGHQKGIIHRDLKPANLLVDTRGHPKVIDFGVARATDSELATTTLRTGIGELVGTVQYMSPEQVEADPHDLDIRSDVYSLGMVLYELLCGRLPYDVSKTGIFEATRIVREQTPAKLGTIDRTLRGDIETIVLKSLEKERERRYQSADELRRDIDRYLNQEPITAHAPSVTYQLTVFARRNKTLVTAVAVVFLVLLTASIFSTYQYVQAEDARYAAVEAQGLSDLARIDAQLEADKAEAVNTFLNDMLAEANPSLNPRGRELTVVEMIDNAAGKIEASFGDQPQLEAAVRITLADAYHALGRLDDAEHHFERALELLRRVLGPRHEDVADCMNRLGEVLLAKALYDKAESTFEVTLDIHREIFGAQHVAVAQSLGGLGSVFSARRDFETAERMLREAKDIAEAVLGEDDLQVAEFGDRLAELLYARRDFDGSVQLFRQSLILRRAQLNADDPQVAENMMNLAVALRSKGELDEAESLYRQALDVMLEVYGEAHPTTATLFNNLARVLYFKGKFQASEEYYRKSLRLHREVYGKDHPEVSRVAFNLAELLRQMGEYEAAEPLCREGLAIVRKSFGEDHSLVAIRLVDLGLVLAGQGDYAAAESHYRQALEIHRNTSQYEQVQVMFALHHMADALQKQDDPAAATVLQESLDIARRLYGDQHTYVAISLERIAGQLHVQGEDAAAETTFKEALAMHREVSGDDHRRVILSMSLLADFYVGVDRTSEAGALLDEIIEKARDALPKGHWRMGTYLAQRGRCLTKLARYEEAEDALVEAHDILVESFGAERPKTLTVATALAELYNAWGKPEEAAKWSPPLNAREP